MPTSRRILRVRIATLALAAALGVRVAEARQCTFGWNLVPNCDFAVDLAEWTLFGDSAVHVPDDGHFAPGCVAIDRNGGPGTTIATSACIEVEPDAGYTSGGSARLASGTQPWECRLSVSQWSEANCSGSVFDPSELVPITNAWTEFSRLDRMQATTLSAQVRFVCYNPAADFVVRLDDFWLSSAIFTDGFESGDTSAWSIAVP